MRLAHLFAAITLFAAAPALADSPQQAAQRLREDAQFDRARAAEFTKFANEDEGIVRQRQNQANDLEKNATNYANRANWHRVMASSYGNNGEQLNLARECDNLATEFRKMAGERRNIANTEQAHVNQWRVWATNLTQRANRSEAIANQLQNAGRL